VDKSLIDKLKKASKFETEADVDFFDQKVYELAQSCNPEKLSVLMDLFDDETEHPEVMYNIVHAIEDCPFDIYVPILMDKIKHALASYPEWYLRFIFGILNSKSHLKQFYKQIEKLSSEERSQLFFLVKSKSKYHDSVLKDLCRKFHMRFEDL
jgi:hypothetical protein